MSNSISFETAVENIVKIRDKKELRKLNSIVVDKIRDFSRREATDKRLEFCLFDAVRITKKSLKGKADRLYNKIGEITKMNPTKAVVSFDGQKWTIPYMMLEKSI